MLEDLRRPMVAGDQDIGKRLVVAQLHVEARPQLLDQIGFEQQRLGLGRRSRRSRRSRSPRSCAGCAPAAARWRARRTTAACGRSWPCRHRARRCAGVEHAVDAGRGRGQPHRVLDRGMADRERAFGDRSPSSSGNLRQPRLVVLVGGAWRDRRRPAAIPVRGGKSGCGTSRSPVAPFGAAAFRIVGRIVVHGRI